MSKKEKKKAISKSDGNKHGIYKWTLLVMAIIPIVTWIKIAC